MSDIVEKIRQKGGILAWDNKQLRNQWQKLGENRIEVGLRKGHAEDRIVTIRSLLHSPEINYGEECSSLTAEGNERDVFFAKVGLGKWSTVKTLNLQYERTSCTLTNYEPANFCFNLSSNTNKIEHLNLEGQVIFGTDRGCELLGEALETNCSLQFLKLVSVKMKGNAVRSLMNHLERNKTLVSLDLSQNPLEDNGIEAVAEFLTRNSTLKCLDIHSTRCGLQGARQLSLALEKNNKLKELVFGDGLVSEGHGVVGESSQNMTENAISEIWQLEEVTQMIRKNKTLSILRLGPASSRARSSASTLGSSSNFDSHAAQHRDYWRDQFFPALKENKTLHELHLNQCKGLYGDDVKSALLDLAGSTKTLRIISLSGTRLEFLQTLLDEELRLNRICGKRLESLTKEQTTSGRLVLCSSESLCPAKTVIRESMKRLENGGLSNSLMPARWKEPRKYLDGGLHVVRLKKQRTAKTTKEPYLRAIWDFEGPDRKFYPMHDSLLPNSCFLYVCSCPHLEDPHGSDSVVRIKYKKRLEFENWMKLIASISKPLASPTVSGRPHVRFVLTCSKDTSDSNPWVDWAKSVVQDLKVIFKDVVELCAIVEIVNADKREHVKSHVKELRSWTNTTLQNILEGSSTNETICEELRHVIARMPGCIPVMSMEHFSCMHLGSINFSEVFLSLPIKEALLDHLRDLGDIVYLKDHLGKIGDLEKKDFVVTDPRWFGVHLLGSIIRMFFGDDFREKISHPNGIVGREDMKNFVYKSVMAFVNRSESQDKDLQTILGDTDLIKAMLCWEICFENEPGNESSSLFVPAVFYDDYDQAATGERKLAWTCKMRTEKFYWFGSRLRRAKKDVTILTPGFFPRLQVHLGNYIKERNWEENPGFNVDTNLISFSVPEMGIEVHVEYGGYESYFVDILVKADFDRSADAETFIQTDVVKKIQSFCTASPQGCQGVTLNKAVIIVEHVRDLHLCKERRTQD